MAQLLMFDSRNTIAGSNVAVNTWHLSLGAVPTTADANALLVPFNTFYNALATIRAATGAVTTGTRVLVADTSTWVKPIGSPGKPGYVKGSWSTPPAIIPATPVTSTIGSGSGQIPPQLASVISWRTNFSGKHGRGRTYLGVLGVSAQSGATLSGTAVTTINNAATALISNVASVTLSGGGAAFLTVWSATMGVMYNIVSGSSDGTFDTMRSRVR